LRGNNQDFTLKFVEPSDRSWERAALLSSLYDNKEMSEEVLNELVAGIVGLEASTAYMAWKKNNEKPVDGVLILKDYAKVQNLIKVQANETTYRPDLINETCKVALAYIQENSTEDKDLPQSEYDNLVSYLLDIPSDLFVDFTRQLFPTHKVFFKIAEEGKPGGRLCDRVEELYAEKEKTAAKQKEDSKKKAEKE
jgi:hypothetical protein